MKNGIKMHPWPDIAYHFFMQTSGKPSVMVTTELTELLAAFTVTK